MKQLLFVAISISLIAGCTKKQDKASGNPITGKWKLTEILISPGPIGTWQPYVSPEPVTIQFSSSGNFSCTPNFPKANLLLDSYTLSGDTIDLTSGFTANTDRWYIRHIDAGRLDISIYTCIEPCALRFIPVE